GRCRVGASRDDLVAAVIAEAKQHYMASVGMPRRALPRQVLQLQLELADRVLIEQLAQLDLAEERAELRRIDGQRLRPELGKGRVTLVHEVRDVVEEQRGREGRRPL